MESSISIEDFTSLVRAEWPGLSSDSVILTPADIVAGADRAKFTGAVGAAADWKKNEECEHERSNQE